MLPVSPVLGQVESAPHGGLFFQGKDGLKGSVDQLRLLENGQRSGNAQSIIGAQGSAIGLEPALFDPGHDGVTSEVVGHVGIGLGHHVEMALENDAGGLFVAWACGLGQAQVAVGITVVSDPLLARPRPR